MKEKTDIRSIRFSKKLLQAARKKDVNINRFVNEALRLYIENKACCPVCLNYIK